MPDAVDLPRSHLIERLNEMVPRSRVVLLRAPGGYGKSRLVEAWARQWDRFPLACLALADGDDAGGGIYQLLSRALRRSDAPVLRSVGSDLAGATAPVALINGLDRVETVLIVDGYHHLQQATSWDLLSTLLAHGPPRLHLVLAGRGDPGVAVGRLRVRAELLELGLGHLAFTDEEVADYASGVNCASDPAVRRALRLTLGWPQGVQMVLGRPDPAGAVRSYFDREMIAWAALRERLERVAQLETLTARSVDALTGGDDGQVWLESLDDAGFLLLPLDDVREAWRFHPLLAAYLQGRLDDLLCR